MGVKVTFDEDKEAKNLKKHHMSLSLAEEMFDNGTMQVAQDFRKEMRHVGYGMLGGRLHVCCYTTGSQPGSVHAVSLRKANTREQEAYAAALLRSR